MQISSVNIDLKLLIITCVFLIAGLFLLLYVRLYNERKKRHTEEKQNLEREFHQQLLQSQIEVQEATYATLGKELHDNIGQLLSTAKIMLGITERKLTVVPDTLVTASQTVSKAIQEIRSLAKILSVEWLQQFSFSENLATEVHRINSAELVKVSLTNEEPDLPLKPEEQIILFRIVQEGLQNAIRHGAATDIQIQLVQKYNQLQLSLRDNGTGFKKEAGKPAGTGLMNMQHRTQLLGGSIEWKPNPDGGTLVYIVLPVNQNVAE
jgi:signal transduction histidine kinase